jgi:hypothetical protein
VVLEVMITAIDEYLENRIRGARPRVGGMVLA